MFREPSEVGVEDAAVSLNGYYLWWGLTPQCFKYKRSCWLLVVVGLTSQCLKCKSIAMPKC